jgi:glutamate 5-kinase
MVAAIVGATWLFLLTDVDALYDKNPNVHHDAKPIRVVDDIDSVVKEGMYACLAPVGHCPLEK